MKRKKTVILLVSIMFLLGGCGSNGVSENEDTQSENRREQRIVQENTDSLNATDKNSTQASQGSADIWNVTEGTEEYKGFILDNILHSNNEGEIHFNLYVPDTYDGSEAYALFLTLPGYEGLYFQGVGENLSSENFGFTAQDYNHEMIIAAPQLEDWSEKSADQVIELIEYIFDNYNIDQERVYAEGYSAGGVTMSQVVGERPELFTAYLQCSSRWAGNFEQVIKSQTPIYFAIGESDEYYGSTPSREAYETLYGMYREEGLSESEIDEILVLDIKSEQYFESRGITDQHGGGLLFAEDQDIMRWLFEK